MAEAEHVLGMVLFVSCSLNAAQNRAAAGRPCVCAEGVNGKVWPFLSFFFFLHLWKKVDLFETFRTFRCLGFIFVQYLQGNSKGVVKQRAESKVTHPISESALRGFASRFL